MNVLRGLEFVLYAALLAFILMCAACIAMVYPLQTVATIVAVLAFLMGAYPNEGRRHS